MNSLEKLTSTSFDPNQWQASLPLPFWLGVQWARHAPRGRGAIPRLLNKTLPSRRKFYIQTRHGAKLACWLGAADTYTDIAAKRGVYEPFILDIIRQQLQQGQTLYDIGGNVGMMSIETAQVFSGDVNIFCFEPQEALAKHIAISAAFNQFDTLSVFNCLLDKQAGEQELHIPSHSIHASMVARDKDIRIERRTAYRLDDLVDNKIILPPNVIKIDVEGAELRVFKGAEKTLKQFQPTIIFEADSNMERFGYSTKDLIQFLSRCADYHYFLINDDESKARLQKIEGVDNLPKNMNILAKLVQ